MNHSKRWSQIQTKKTDSMDRWLCKEVGLYTKWLTVKGRLHKQAAGQTYLFTRAIICHGVISIPGMKRDKRWHKFHLLAWKLGQIRWAVEKLIHFVCKNALREKEDSIEKGNREDYNKPFPSETNDVNGQTILTLQFFQWKLFDETFAWQYFSGFHKNTPYSPYTFFCLSSIDLFDKESSILIKECKHCFFSPLQLSSSSLFLYLLSLSFASVIFEHIRFIKTCLMALFHSNGCQF